MTGEDEKELVVYINGKFLPLSQARISPLDRGFLLGDGVFETLRSYGGEPVLLARHLRRLGTSARALNIPGVPGLRKTREILEKLHQCNGLKEAYIRITLSRGEGGELAMVAPAQPTLLMLARTLTPYSESWYCEGVRVVLSDIRRNATSPVLRHKALSYLECIWAKEEARNHGAQEALFLNTRGEVAEGATTNIFFVKQGTVCTPALEANILPGVTREVVLEICRLNHIPVQEGLFALADLTGSEEAFLTNSLMGIMPIAKCSTSTYHVSPDTLTSKIARLYKGLVRERPGERW